jgi:subtilisin family serine protease
MANDPREDQPRPSTGTAPRVRRSPPLRVDGAAAADPGAADPSRLRAATLSEAFTIKDRVQREQMGMPPDDDTPTPIVVEMNLVHAEGLGGARERFRELHEALTTTYRRRPPILIADTYYRCYLSVTDVRRLIANDQKGTDSKRRAIYRVWPDFRMKALIDRSVSTIKADAARRSYDASGTDIVWAVIDSGIDETHPHFTAYGNLNGDVSELHRDFTTDEPAKGGALIDRFGHGTHVAGIIAGGLEPARGQDERPVFIGQRVAVSESSDQEQVEPRPVTLRERLTGVAPRCKLISLKVLDDGGNIRSTDVLRALEYVRVELNGHGKPPLRVHGVNLSLGYEFNAKWFACGQSPVCVEVDRLVRSGVVVVIAAGNTGYGELTARTGITSTGLSLTINDPGNAELGITVGATHRDSPHTYGVSFFSSKGPTGDGRLKPDLVAPGERITSCATGRALDDMKEALDRQWPQGVPEGVALYIDRSGTSMAAPHVSGAIASFLSIRREFIGRPEHVKRVFLDNATSLGRERYFEGHGLVDLMRVIQAV